jgi:hypothetical protein
MAYAVKVTALNDLLLKDVTMHIPMGKTLANNMKGLGQKYGARPEKVEYKWGGPLKEEIWLGNDAGGLQYALVDESAMKPIAQTTLKKSSSTPSSWNNNGKGGIVVGIKGSSMLANNFTGEHQMKKGDILYYNFTVLIASSPK